MVKPTHKDRFIYVQWNSTCFEHPVAVSVRVHSHWCKKKQKRDEKPFNIKIYQSAPTQHTKQWGIPNAREVYGSWAAPRVRSTSDDDDDYDLIFLCRTRQTTSRNRTPGQSKTKQNVVDLCLSLLWGINVVSVCVCVMRWLIQVWRSRNDRIARNYLWSVELY